jgi:hypothetical protein
VTGVVDHTPETLVGPDGAAAGTTISAATRKGPSERANFHCVRTIASHIPDVTPRVRDPPHILGREFGTVKLPDRPRGAKV